MKKLLLILSVTFLPLTMMIDGFVLSQLWEWFIASKFQLPILSLIEGMGLILIFYFLRSKYNHKEAKEKHLSEEIVEKAFGDLIFVLVSSAMYLTIGYILTYLL